MTDATEALGLLDTDRLSFIADKLQALLRSQTVIRSTCEINARQRVFASAFRATKENMNILQRVACEPGEATAWER